MANLYYNRARGRVAGASPSIDLLGDTLKVALLKAGYTEDPDHTVLDNGANNATDPSFSELTVAGYARQTLGTKTITVDDTNDRAIFDAADAVFAGLATGETIVAALLFKEQGTPDDTTSELIGHFDLTSTPTNGGSVTVAWATTTGLIIY